METTGLSPLNDRIIEVGAVLFENGEIIKRYSTLVNPEVFVPYSATVVNHITNEMVQNAPKEKVVYAELIDFLGDALNQQTAISGVSDQQSQHWLGWIDRQSRVPP